MSTGCWNHNIHYHDIVLRSVPSGCRRALDVGCGSGRLARQLAGRCDEVIGIDIDHDTLLRARTASASEARIAFVEGDVMTHPFPDDDFDLVAAVATLHHLPLRLALARFRNLLKSGGVLAIVGLYRAHKIEDYAWAAAALPSSWLLRCLNGCADVDAPLHEPMETLREIRTACDDLLPGAVFRRHLLFRYSIVWRKTQAMAYSCSDCGSRSS
jgi:SAM-dependent methyltransferase